MTRLAAAFRAGRAVLRIETSLAAYEKAVVSQSNMPTVRYRYDPNSSNCCMAWAAAHEELGTLPRRTFIYRRDDRALDCITDAPYQTIRNHPLAVCFSPCLLRPQSCDTEVHAICLFLYSFGRQPDYSRGVLHVLFHYHCHSRNRHAFYSTSTWGSTWRLAMLHLKYEVRHHAITCAIEDLVLPPVVGTGRVSRDEIDDDHLWHYSTLATSSVTSSNA